MTAFLKNQALILYKHDLNKNGLKNFMSLCLGFLPIFVLLWPYLVLVLICFSFCLPPTLTGEEELIERFRPNLIVRTHRPFEEDDWTRLQIGAHTFVVRTKDVFVRISNIRVFFKVPVVTVTLDYL